MELASLRREDTMNQQSEKKKGKPRRALRSRSKYDLYRYRVGKPERDGHREHHRQPKPQGILWRSCGGVVYGQPYRMNA